MALQLIPETRKRENQRRRENAGIPPLYSGDHLTKAEFRRRYQATSDSFRAELIKGVVYVSSPVSFPHAEVHSKIMAWLGVYSAAFPGTRTADNVSLTLTGDNDPQPDGCMWLDPQRSGASGSQEGYLVRVPEFIVEVAASSAAYDLHDKMDIYEQNGVQEYLVLQLHEKQCSWFVLVNGAFQPFLPDKDSVYRSQVFPGLWLDSERFWADDMAGVLATLQQGENCMDHWP